MKTIAQRLKSFRLRAGLSQKQVAEKIRVPPSTYRDWEYGTQIKGEPYVKLAEVFNVSLLELLTGEIQLETEFRAELRQLQQVVDNLRRLTTQIS